MHVDPDGEHPIVALALAGTAAYLGSTQFANAPGPNDPTFNGAPFADEALVAGAVGPASALARTTVRTAVAGGRSFMKTLTGPATVRSVQQQATAQAAGTMGFAEAVTLTGTLARTTTTTASNATLSASQNIGTRVLTNYGGFSAATGTAGFLTGALTPLEPSDADISLNPLLAPFQVGNLLGGIATSEVPSFGNPFSGGSSGLK
jgi:hypothetical protein